MNDCLLVTGATGFIGGRLAEVLVRDGRRVRLLVRRPERLRDSLAGCEVVQGDLADGEVLRKAVRGVSQVFHCAANVATWDSWEHYQAANVTGLRKLLEQLAIGAPELRRFVHFSTVDVYGFPASPCDETAPLPKNPFGYGESKRLGEQVVWEYARSRGLPVTVLRPCNVIGPGSPFVERIGAELKNGLMLKIDGGRANAGLVYVDNLVRYAICLAASSEAEGEVFNVRDPCDVSWGQFLADLQAGIASRGWTIDLPYGLAEVAARSLAGAYQLLGSGGEPLLHPLLVRIFGRTCGHDASRLHALCQLPDAVDYDEAMRRSCEWFVQRA